MQDSKLMMISDHLKFNNNNNKMVRMSYNRSRSGAYKRKRNATR